MTSGCLKAESITDISRVNFPHFLEETSVWHLQGDLRTSQHLSHRLPFLNTTTEGKQWTPSPNIIEHAETMRAAKDVLCMCPTADIYKKEAILGMHTAVCCEEKTSLHRFLVGISGSRCSIWCFDCLSHTGLNVWNILRCEAKLSCLHRSTQTHEIVGQKDLKGN